MTNRLLLSQDYLSDPTVALGESVEPRSAPGFELVTASSSQGEISIRNGTVELDVGDMAGFGAVVVAIEVQVTRRGVLYCQAAVEAADPDPDPRNNRRIAPIFVPDAAELIIRRADWISFEICWPATPQAFLLQASAAAGAPWSTLEIPLSENNGWNCTRIERTGEGRLFRLFRWGTDLPGQP
jgi:hypothetical protein